MNDYLTYWKADTAVFLRQISTASLFIPAALRQSLDLLRLFCTTESHHLMVMTGASGTGKSTLLRWLAAELPTSTHDLLTLSLVRDEHEPGWLAPRLAAALGAPPHNQDPHLAIDFVGKRLDDLIEQKRQLIVAIDSAHLVRTRVGLQEVLAILNIQTLSERCVSFVISGEPTLMNALAETPGLTGKIALHVHLAPLSFEETRDYLAHRLRLAGVRNPFEDEAIRIIYERSQGVMLSTDIFAEHCLIEAAAQGSPKINSAVALGAERHLPKSLLQNREPAMPLGEAPENVWSEIDEIKAWPLKTTVPPSHVTQASRDTLDSEVQDIHLLDLGMDPAFPPPPMPSESKKESKTAPEPPPVKHPTEENAPSHAGSTSIRLSSLFKSEPSPPKPKKGS